jgi:hypothetical protein
MRIAGRIVKIAVVLLATWFLAIPQLPATWHALSALASARLSLVAVGAACSVAALLAYAQLMRTTLDQGTRPGLWHTFGIIMTSLGISNVLPAGSAAGTVVTYKMLQRAGVARLRAAGAMAMTSVGSAIVLNVLLVLGLIALLPSHGFVTGALAALPSTALIVGLTLFGRATARRRPRLWAWADRLDRRLSRSGGGSVSKLLTSFADQLDEWRSRPRMLTRAVLWAAINWLIDVAALWIVLAAVGVTLNPTSVLVAFALANIAAMLPITPGGLGVVELTLTATLVGLGAPAAATAVGVAIYRLLSFWIPIPVSAVSYVATRTFTADVHRQGELAPVASAPAA